SFGYDAKINRPYGIFFQPNLMASFMATGTTIGAYLLMFTTKKTTRIFLYFNIIVTAFVITVLLSRTGWLSLACITPLIIMGLWRYDKKVTLYVTLCIMVGTLWGCAENFLWRDITNLMADRVSMQSPRAYTYPQTLALWLEKPWLGWGYGLFEPAYLQFSAKGYANGVFDHPGLVGLAHAHNEILQLGAQGGIIPVIGFLLAVTAIISCCLQQPARWLVIAIFTPLALHTQLEYPFYHSIPHWFIFILLVFIFDNGKQQSLPAPSTLTLRLSAIFLSTLCSIFMLTTMHTTYNLYRYETGNRQDLSLVVNNLNPIAWYRHLNFYLTAQSINAAVATEDKEKLKLIEPWIKDDMRYYPRPEYYNMLSIIYHQLGKSEELTQLSQGALYLLPQDTTLFASNYFKKNVPQLYALHKKISKEIEQSSMDSATNKRHITEK
ncbi:MAG: Wzy polymerase domain-containing protein, partial [Plesiomonas shigelloides]